MLHSGLCIMYNRAVRARWQFYCVQWSCARYVTILLCTIELCALCGSLIMYNGAVRAMWQSYCVQWSCARYVTILLCTIELCAPCDIIVYNGAVRVMWRSCYVQSSCARFMTILLCTMELCALCDNLIMYNGAVRAMWQSFGCGGSSVGRASDRYTADAGSIPRCGKGFFSQSQLSVQTLLRCPYTPVFNRMHLHLCAR